MDNTLFTVKQEDISALGDTDLRELTGMLCGAELHDYGYTDAPVRYDGHQDARDGGVDVRVSASKLGYENGYIPKAQTIFQVKVPKMTDGKIKQEMRPKGELLSAIAALADTGGAYVIISSKASYTDSGCQQRTAVMASLLDGLPVQVDYYGSRQMAKWVNQYPSIITWVKARLGKPLRGWEPFGNWAKVPKKARGSYVIDEGIVVRAVGDKNKEWTGIGAVDHVRKLLRKEGGSVRLIGISGVGKTRFVQALFEKGIGDSPLLKSAVMYTNFIVSQTPSPRDMLLKIQETGRQEVLVIDNCSSAMHRELTSLLQAEESRASLLTIEYDIREGDLPEGSEALKLEAGTPELVGKVLKRTFPLLTYAATQRLGIVAGGNFRLAKAMAERVAAGEDLAILKDEELFTRVFHQKKILDKELLAAAEILSLVYSFDLNTEVEDAELVVLAELGELSLRNFKRQIAELKDRDLVQERGHWGAILPPAIANWLASRALRQFSVSEINNCFLVPGRRRLFKSLANRLGFLANSPEASALGNNWLARERILWDVTKYDRDLFAVFANVAIVSEAAALNRIEAWTKSVVQYEWIISSHHQESVLRVLVYLGYEAHFFERVVLVLMDWYKQAKNDNDQKQHGERVGKFFQLYLSGTKALPEARVSVLENLIDCYTDDPELIRQLLEYALGVFPSRGHPHYTEGKNRMNYGYWPTKEDEVKEWFRLHLDLLQRLISSGGVIRKEGVTVFDFLFKTLYSKDELRSDVLKVVECIESTGGWGSGWLVINQAIDFYKVNLPEEQAVALKALRERFRPRTIKERIEMYLHLKHGDLFDLKLLLAPENITDGDLALASIARVLGEEINEDKDLLSFAFSGLLRVFNESGAYAFGERVGKVISFDNVLPLLHDVFAEVPSSDISSYDSLRGLVFYLYDRDVSHYHDLIDEVEKHVVLRKHILPLQLNHIQDQLDLERLDRVVGAPYVFERHYVFLSEQAINLPEATLVNFLERIMIVKGGEEQVLTILSNLINKGGIGFVLPRALFDIVEQLASWFPLVSGKEGRQRINTIRLVRLIESSFSDSQMLRAAVKLMGRLATNFRGRLHFPYEFKKLTEAVAIQQPRAVLEAFVEDVDKREYWDNGLTYPDQIRYLLTSLPIAVVRDWVAKDLVARSKDLAYCLIPFTSKERVSVHPGWHEKAILVLDSTVDEDVLGWFHASFRSRTAVGDAAAAIMELCVPLVALLDEHASADVRDWVMKELTELRTDAAMARIAEINFWKTEEAEPRFE